MSILEMTYLQTSLRQMWFTNLHDNCFIINGRDPRHGEDLWDLDDRRFSRKESSSEIEKAKHLQHFTKTEPCCHQLQKWRVRWNFQTYFSNEHCCNVLVAILKQSKHMRKSMRSFITSFLVQPGRRDWCKIPQARSLYERTFKNIVKQYMRRDRLDLLIWRSPLPESAY